VIWPSIEWYVAGHSVPYRPGSHTAPVVHTTSKVSYYEFARLPAASRGSISFVQSDLVR
jgi:hypothetical protein